MTATVEAVHWSAHEAARHVGEIVPQMHEIIHSSVWSTSRLANLLSEADESELGFTPDNSLACFALAYRSRDFNEFMYPGPVIILRRLFVRPDIRDRGLGKATLRRLLARATAPVMWQTAADSHDAIAWFYRQSFRPCGSITDGTSTDLIFRIPPGNPVSQHLHPLRKNSRA